MLGCMPSSPARTFLRPAALLFVFASLALAGCAGLPASGSTGAAEETEKLRVAANFYPVQFLAQRIGGDHVEVEGLTPPGTEPHDLALSGPALQRLRSSDVVLYLGSSFQPDVEKAVASLPGGMAVDLLAAPGLGLLDPPAAAGEENGDHHDRDHAGEATEKDPHVWLDPVRLALMAREVADAMAAADPSRTAAYEGNLQALLADLDALHRELEQQLDQCDGRALLTSHAAFGYLAERYSLDQIAIAGISPEDEPDAKSLAAISSAASAAGVTSVFLEEQLNPDLAHTVAGTIGATTLTLSALEFDPGVGQDLLTVMRDNGHQISQGLGCR